MFDIEDVSDALDAAEGLVDAAGEKIAALARGAWQRAKRWRARVLPRDGRHRIATPSVAELEKWFDRPSTRPAPQLTVHSLVSRLLAEEAFAAAA